MKDIQFKQGGTLVKSVPEDQIQSVTVDAVNRVYVNLKLTGGTTTAAKVVAYVGSTANQNSFLQHLNDVRDSLRNANTPYVTIDTADLDFVTSIVNS